jgi:RNase P/RNase MRP subunit p30
MTFDGLRRSRSIRRDIHHRLRDRMRVVNILGTAELGLRGAAVDKPIDLCFSPWFVARTPLPRRLSWI